LPSASGPASIERCVSYSDIVNYTTTARASLFLQIFRGNFSALECEISLRSKKLMIPKLRSQPREPRALTRPT
jgi:hypothetical protein